MIKIICPVPQNQRPINEFNSMRNSWIISWPLLEKTMFYKKLIISTFSILPITLLVSSGSLYLRNNTSQLILTSIISSFIFPILILFRQWLSWKYIFKRLNSEKIEYEESGWYDGQTWEKPISWRAKEFLIAQHQVKPVLNNIEKILMSTILFVFFSLSYTLANINL